MSINKSSRKTTTSSWIVLLLVLTGGFVAGATARHSSVAQADVRRTPERTTLRTASARSETVLREISSTLTRIDRRLERMERLVSKKPD